MDPNATLKLALEAIEEKDREAAVEALEALANWLDKGGFFPKPPHTTDPVMDEFYFR